MHRASERYWKCFSNLPDFVQKLARKKFELLRNNPQHPSLHFKKVGKFWSARVGILHRALAIKDDEDFIWVWLGTHDEYERIIKESA